MCDCVKRLEAEIKDHNTAIVTEVFSGNAVIATYKLDSKKRGKPLAARASFCPFCGEKYRYPHREDPLGTKQS